MKTAVVTQSNYIPWRGYFSMIAQADELILLDSVQYTRRDWRNRNVIKTPSGRQWITIPVQVTGRYHQAVDETRVADSEWAETHIRALQSNYRRAHAYDSIAPWLFENLRAAAAFPLLSEVNIFLISEICRKLQVQTPIRRCSDVLARSALISMEPTERLLKLCLAIGATRYLSGPAAKNYLNTAKFSEAGMEVSWMDYSGLTEYPQCWGAYERNVSIVDLLLNCGEASPDYLQTRLLS